MENVTIIVPVHEFNVTVKKYLTKALASVANMGYDNRVLFVGKKNVLDKIKENATYTNVSFVENIDTDVFKQINAGASQCLTRYFSVLEFDDTYTPNWFKSAKPYIQANPNATVYMPLVEIKDGDASVEFGNAIAWSPSFADNLGFINEKELKIFCDFILSGAIINTEDFLEFGMLKPDFKQLAWYEFLLNVRKHEKDIYVVPKDGYYHTINRKGSYSDTVGTEGLDGIFEKIKTEYFKEDAE